MPELPDITIYLEALERLLVGERLARVHIRSPFVLRTFEPAVEEAVGRRVIGLRRVGKRIVWEFEEELFFVFHLMIAGRFHLRKAGAAARGKNDLAAFEFPAGTLLLTEASAKKRAALHVVRGAAAVEVHRPPGLEPLEISLEVFASALTARNHTLKRALTDPTIFSGIGNAYSDAIRHAARLATTPTTNRLAADAFPRRWRPFAPRGRCTAVTASPAPHAERPCSESVTPTAKRTTAPAAKRAAACWPIGPFRGF